MRFMRRWDDVRRLLTRCGLRKRRRMKKRRSGVGICDLAVADWEARRCREVEVVRGLHLDDDEDLDVLRADEGGVEGPAALLEDDDDGVVADVALAAEDVVRLHGQGREVAADVEDDLEGRVGGVGGVEDAGGVGVGDSAEVDVGGGDGLPVAEEGEEVVEVGVLGLELEERCFVRHGVVDIEHAELEGGGGAVEVVRLELLDLHDPVLDGVCGGHRPQLALLGNEDAVDAGEELLLPLALLALGDEEAVHAELGELVGGEVLGLDAVLGGEERAHAGLGGLHEHDEQRADDGVRAEEELVVLAEEILLEPVEPRRLAPRHGLRLVHGVLEEVLDLAQVMPVQQLLRLLRHRVDRPPAVRLQRLVGQLARGGG